MWEQAQADLEAARAMAGAGLHFATSWHAQQATEKGLKALYIERRGMLAPRTHDLAFLAREVGVPSNITVDIPTVNPAFDIVRYPDPIRTWRLSTLWTRPPLPSTWRPPKGP